MMPDFCSRRNRLHITTALMNLVQLGVDIGRIRLLADGEQENYKGEIHEQEPAPGTPITPTTEIVLKVGFPSAIDQMPYQFFYGLFTNSARTSEWEMRSRELMAAFDAELIRHLAVASYQEKKYTLSFVDMDHLARFLSLFAFDVRQYSRDVKEALIWSALFPTFHYWAGNPRYVEKALSLIFGYEFRIKENVAREYEIPEPLRYKLGSASDRLGRGTILGRSFTERDSCYEVIMRGVAPDDVKRFLPGQPGRKKLEEVLSICMPGDLEYRLKIRPKRSQFRLGQKEKRSYLGYATYA